MASCKTHKIPTELTSNLKSFKALNAKPSDLITPAIGREIHDSTTVETSYRDFMDSSRSTLQITSTILH